MVEATVKCGKVVATLGEVLFSANFDSGNLDRVEECLSSERDVLEYNLWLASDCAATQYQNSNRTWFYFSVTMPPNFNKKVLRFNILNMNRQARLYNQGLAPIIKVVPGRGSWERLREYVECEVLNEDLKLTFTYTVADSRRHTVFFAFCYPFSYAESQKKLSALSERFNCPCTTGPGRCPSDQAVYYHREHLCHTLEGRRVDLITVSSHHDMREEREAVLPGLFPAAASEPRPRLFAGKKVVFISSRVHPGETPSSHVFNGFLGFLLRTDDPRSQLLRRHFVFKLVPMLNPDGVFRGHYRTDSRGVNLNRVYLDPDRELHPSINAVKQLFLYYHGGGGGGGGSGAGGGGQPIPGGTSVDHAGQITSVKPCDTPVAAAGSVSTSDQGTFICTGSGANSVVNCAASPGPDTLEHEGVPVDSSSSSSISSNPSTTSGSTPSNPPGSIPSTTSGSTPFTTSGSTPSTTCGSSPPTTSGSTPSSTLSGIALYVDLHAHATKRGCFLYGNHFADEATHTESMLFPRLVSLNSTHVDFEHCVFSEKNMYAADKRTGQSKEGSGRVGLYHATGIIYSYTLECNYNSGRMCNGKAPAVTDDSGRVSPPQPSSPFPHKYSIDDFEEVGRGVGVALLDLYGLNPFSRLPNTELGSLDGVRASLMGKVRASRAKAEAIRAELIKDGSNTCKALDDEWEQSERPAGDQYPPADMKGQPPTRGQDHLSPTGASRVSSRSRSSDNPNMAKRASNSRKIDERRLELRQRIKAAKISLMAPLGPSSSFHHPRSGAVQLPAQPGTDISEKNTFWVSLSTTKPSRKRNGYNCVKDSSLSVTGVCVSKQQQQHLPETKQDRFRKSPCKLLPRRASEKNTKFRMTVQLPTRACSDGELK